ncbi:MAG: cyclic nucleotide-binding domain-containing protein, partial [Candidatus Latescibacteria bacterium]|nr:cyclic nucleotide-binding domain-containing protein [Candidatus Latescibacterota bacterium]
NRPGRKSERLATATSGMIFGEISLVDGSPRSAGARTMEETSVLEIMSEDIRAVMDKHPRIGYVIMKNLATVLSARLRNTNIWLRNELIWSR